VLNAESQVKSSTNISGRHWLSLSLPSSTKINHGFGNYTFTTAFSKTVVQIVINLPKKKKNGYYTFPIRKLWIIFVRVMGGEMEHHPQWTYGTFNWYANSN